MKGKIEKVIGLCEALGYTRQQLADAAGITTERLSQATDDDVEELLTALRVIDRVAEGVPTCVPTRPEAKLCVAMRMYASTGRGKGLRYAQLSDMKTGKNTRTMLSYHEKPSDRGTAINVCPWCGGGLVYALCMETLAGDEPREVSP